MHTLQLGVFLSLAVLRVVSQSNCVRCVEGSSCDSKCPPFATESGGVCSCNAGFFMLDAECVLCTADSYCPGGHTSGRRLLSQGGDIEPCPNNSQSILGADSESMCLCNSGYTALACAEPPCDPVCTACAPGTYKTSVSNVEACEPCPSGTYGASPHECAPCPNSSISEPGSSHCVCAAGTRALDSACVLCDESVLCAGGNATACAAGATVRNSQCVCGEGSYCPGGNLSCTGAACEPCPANMWCADNVASACESNAAAPENSTRCWCIDGFYRAHGECLECPLHYVCVNETRRAVADFDAGLRTLDTGTASLASAVCAPGMFRTAPTDVCKPCPRNFFCPPEVDAAGVPFGLPNVVRCPDNEYTPTTGAQARSECICKAGFKLSVSGDTSLCLPCAIGERCQAGYVLEELCHVSNKVPSASHDACVCERGYGLDYFDCIQCAPGFVKPDAGDTLCAPCADGTYSSNTTTCVACPEGATARSGSAACLCPPPYVWAAGACTLCPDDHFWEASACHACPVLARSVSRAGMPAGPAACVCPQTYVALPQNVSGALQCVQCPAGQYEDKGTCLMCPSGAWAPEGSTALPANSSAWSVCACNSSCHGQRVDGSCAGECAAAPPACTACAAGHSKDFTSAVGNTDMCLACGPGTYQAGTGATACDECPENEFHELEQQSSVAACLCVAGFERLANASCTACTRGHYKDWLSNAPCLQCAVAKYSAHEQATACLSCASATASKEQFALALQREAALVGADFPANFSANFSGNVSTDFSGNFSANFSAYTANVPSVYAAHGGHVLASNTTAHDGAHSVLQCVCEVGHEPAWHDGAWSCQQCLPGSFKETRSHTQCTYCGAPSPTHGHALLHHYGAPEWGASDVGHCVQCPAFSGQDESLVGPGALRMSSASDCLCFRGHEATEQGCSNCSLFMVQPQFSNSLCTHCPAGHYYVARHVPCQLCDLAQDDGERHVGLVANARDPYAVWGDHESDCVCRPGFERDVHGTCHACQVGKFRNATSTRHCELCAADFFQDTTAQLLCKSCPPHSSTLARLGAMSVFECVCDAGFEPMSDPEGCLPCPAGTYSPARSLNESSVVCRQCPENHFCPPGASRPEPCPPGELAAAASQTQQQCTCAPGHERNQTDLQCAPCARGYFAATGTNAPCSQCPANKTTVSVASTSEHNCVCVPGHETLDNSSTASCTPCASGYFAPGFRNQKCTSCGWGTITLPLAAASHAGACQCSATLGLSLFF